MAKNTLYLASFNAERFWRKDSMSNLPSFVDKQADTIIEAMDETQFLFSNHADDVVCTRYPMNKLHREYLWELGFKFKNNEQPLENIDLQIPDFSQGMCELIYNHRDKFYFNGLLESVDCLSPFAIIPFAAELCGHFAVNTRIPSLEVTKKVNSKIFSTVVAQDCHSDLGGHIINSSEDLRTLGLELLERMPFLIKDPFGVSGKGNILIEKEHTLNHICKYLNKQELTGKETQFLIEPFVARKVDFSSQFTINEDGSYDLMAVQQMNNKGFSFSGIQGILPSFYEMLEKKGYFGIVEKVAGKLFNEGYFGPVCLDSMILEDGAMVPIVEINARKSMSFLNLRVTQYLAPYQVFNNLITFSFSSSGEVTFEELYRNLEENNLLFNLNNLSGLLPLSANTFDINSKLSREMVKGMVKGRLYACLIYKNHKQMDELYTRLLNLFENLNLRLL
ncbi:hypothetical protein [Pedobacter jejuensis]|uniref:ATP-grasp domain-containing protein n=1 Tax=Pedobacter jejuensis TaxID=1268550 RepID=A0A3N0BW85_9SPHI|nr:hypothetical protein [Pedobacter jejuensis]RNL53964.1 hypothetical protein D7004_07640 [Pedobacter jejuensis]